MNLLNVLETAHLGLDCKGVIWLDWLEGYDHEAWDFPRAVGLVGGPIAWPDDLRWPEWVEAEWIELQVNYEESAWLDKRGEGIAAFNRAIGDPGRWVCPKN